MSEGHVSSRLDALSLAIAVAAIVVPLVFDLMLVGFESDPSDTPLLIVLGVLFLVGELAAVVMGWLAPKTFTRTVALYIAGLSLACGGLFVFLLIV